MNPGFRVLLLVGGLAIWTLPFIAFRPKAQKAVKILPAARWGIALEMAGFFVANIHSPAVWKSPFEPWRAGLAVLFALSAVLLGGRAIRHLGKQWRIDAG